MSGYKVYLNSKFEPAPKDAATLIKAVADDGSVAFYHPRPVAPTANANTQKADVHAWYTIADEPPAPAMDAEYQKTLFASLIAKWQGILLLDEWELTFTVKDVPRVEQGIVVAWTEKRAEIELSSRLTPETAEDDIAHELLHLVLYPENWKLDEHADEMLRRKAIDADEYTALQESFNLAQNVTIESLKRILAKAGIGR